MVKRNSEALNETEVVVPLDSKKQVTVRKFNNINLVDIREFYEDKVSGEKKPGKKGISLTEDLWKKLVASAPEIQAALDNLKGNKKRKAEEPKESKESKKKMKEEKVVDLEEED